MESFKKEKDEKNKRFNKNIQKGKNYIQVLIWGF
jgi:hypothetical protein